MKQVHTISGMQFIKIVIGTLFGLWIFVGIAIAFVQLGNNLGFIPSTHLGLLGFMEDYGMFDK